jgi:hypothetical protein
MTQQEFEALIDDDSKMITGDVIWSEDEDRSPSVEFRVEVSSSAGYPLFIRASFNALAQTLSYVLIHRGVGRIYGLDLGKDHHNPSCEYVGEKHKHRWTELQRDKAAYVPQGITAGVNEPLEVWNQFCREARIMHSGTLRLPPPIQLDFL